MEIPDILSYVELRRETAKHPANGEYAIQICVKCKAFLFNVDGDVRTAKIVDQCKECFEQKVIE